MSKPVISVVLPTHNGRRFIDQSIESVTKQTCRDWELIVVNDASTDDTPALIDRWAARDNRVVAVHLPKNRTLPGALNEGFARASGRFHAWTSDDNWYHPEALARMLAVLETDSGVGIVHTDATVVNEYGTPIATAQARPAERLFEENGIGACFLYRREVFAELKGYDEDLFGAEDYDFWLRIARSHLFDYVDEVLVDYRAGTSTSVFGDFVRLVKEALHIQRRFIERFYSEGYPQPTLLKKGVAEKYAQLGDMFLGQNKHLGALVAHASSLAWEPLKLARYRALLRDLVPNWLVDRIRSAFKAQAVSRQTDIRRRSEGG